MKKEMKTMEEKMKLNPDEIMENGLTRAHNEKIEQDSEAFGGFISIICGLIGLWCVLQAMSNM
jgi:hypothetical protein